MPAVRYAGAAARSAPAVAQALRILKTDPGSLTADERATLAGLVEKGARPEESSKLRQFAERAPVAEIDKCGCAGCRYITAWASARPWGS